MRYPVFIFLLFLAVCNCQIHGFLNTVIAVPMSWNIWVVIWCRSMTSWFQLFLNSSNSLQKAVALTIPAKNRRKINKIDLYFQIKKFICLQTVVSTQWSSHSGLLTQSVRQMSNFHKSLRFVTYFAAYGAERNFSLVWLGKVFFWANCCVLKCPFRKNELQNSGTLFSWTSPKYGGLEHTKHYSSYSPYVSRALK